MSRIAFVTDSTLNLPDEIIQRYNISIVPVYVIFGDQSFKEYVDLSPEEFYRRLADNKAAGKEMPTTSQPTPEDFRNCYAALTEQGYSDILSIHLTSKSSGTYNSAMIASTLIEGVNVHVVDTLTTSMHSGFMLLEAIETIARGGGVAEAIAAVERVKQHSCMHFTVTDLQHLASSGRTEDHQKSTEAAISVKPVIAIADGIPKSVGVERTQHAALDKVLDLTCAQMGEAHPLRVAIVNGNIPEKAAQWGEEVCAALGFEGKPYIVDFGPGLAVHFGPGLLGVTVQWG